MNFKNLFNKVTADPSQPAPASVRKDKETYQQWGIRWAGQTNAASLALNSSLAIVICQLKKEQASDSDKQETNRKALQGQIDGIKASRDIENNNLSSEEKKLSECVNLISEKKNKLEEIESNGDKGENRMAKLNLWIGGIITLLITIYLFVFYSSASYSAFFKIINANVSTTEACFDGQAWFLAFKDGLMEFLFVTLLPVLFMGLGYVIYQYGQKQGIEKYIKATILYGITFIFDTLLAYQISKKIYIAISQTQLAAVPPYNVSFAIQNGDFWIIIFCGFIAYVIWGLVFGFAMKSYELLDSKNFEIKNLKKEIDDLQKDSKDINTNIINLKNKIVTIDADIKQKEYALPKSVLYDYNIIKQELHNFFNGWVGYMSLVAKTTQDTDEAKNIFNGFIDTINNILQSNPSNVIPAQSQLIASENQSK